MSFQAVGASPDVHRKPALGRLYLTETSHVRDHPHSSDAGGEGDPDAVEVLPFLQSGSAAES